MTPEETKLLEALNAWALKQAKLYKKNPDWLADQSYNRDWAEGFLEGLDSTVYGPLGEALCAAFERQCETIKVTLTKV